MFFTLGKPLRLDFLDKDPLSLAELKSKFEILLIDDNPPAVSGSLRQSGFRVVEMLDIPKIDVVEPYPIVACDIEGIGKSFRPNTRNGGIHVLREIRKHYPDKYLIQYSTKSQDIDGSLTKADVIFPKDTTLDAWQDQIEKSLRELGNPKKRWMRVRGRLSDEGVDGYDIFKLEQEYIKSLSGVSHSVDKVSGFLSPQMKDLVIKFFATTAAMKIKEILLNG